MIKPLPGVTVEPYHVGTLEYSSMVHPAGRKMLRWVRRHEAVDHTEHHQNAQSTVRVKSETLVNSVLRASLVLEHVSGNILRNIRRAQQSQLTSAFKFTVCKLISKSVKPRQRGCNTGAVAQRDRQVDHQRSRKTVELGQMKKPECFAWCHGGIDTARKIG